MNVPCKHEHMRFGDSGRTLTCIDCPQAWHTVTKSGNLDNLYSHPMLSSFETRHGMFTIPRSKPIPKPAKK